MMSLRSLVFMTSSIFGETGECEALDRAAYNVPKRRNIDIRFTQEDDDPIDYLPIHDSAELRWHAIRFLSSDDSWVQA